MLKHIGILYILVVVSSSFIHAGTSDSGNNPQLQLSDTMKVEKDSLAAVQELSNDSKKDFPETEKSEMPAYHVSKEMLRPEAIEFVDSYIEKFGSTLNQVKEKGKPYLDMMDEVLSDHGIPKELKYLAVIESYLNPNARSVSGAVGAWQFMPATARNMGLTVSRKIDERRNIYKSTHAACRYLTSLYGLYGDWLLVVAAYNSGPGFVNSAIKKSGSEDFWELQQFLPTQAKNHVKKFIATHYFMEGYGSIATLTKNEVTNLLMNPDILNSAEDLADSETRKITGRFNAGIIAKYIEMDLETFYRINPDFDRKIADEGKYELHLPSDKMNLFIEKRNDILNESIQLLLKPVNNTSDETVNNTTPAL